MVRLARGWNGRSVELACLGMASSGVMAPLVWMSEAKAAHGPSRLPPNWPFHHRSCSFGPAAPAEPASIWSKIRSNWCLPDDDPPAIAHTSLETVNLQLPGCGIGPVADRAIQGR